MLATVLGCAACPDGGDSVDAAVGDLGAADQSVALDLAYDGGGLTTAAFSIVGCDSFSVSEVGPLCIGRPPLTVTFVSLLSGVDTVVWTFASGDPATSMALSPTVTFSAPGSYAVKLAVSGPGGTSVYSGTVQLTPGGVGDACRDDADCGVDQTLVCLCPGGSCAGGLALGLCTRDCDLYSCDASSICADLGRARPKAPAGGDGGAVDDGGASFTDPWRRHLCLRTCQADAECRPGLLCLALPTLPGGAYQKACMAPLAGSLGDPCRDAKGVFDDSRCFSGKCLAVGAYGECTDHCSSGSCPSGACGHFAGAPGEALCLRACTTASDCADPLLGCRSGGGDGTYDFAAETNGTFCAPRPCNDDDTQCSPLGACEGGYCRR